MRRAPSAVRAVATTTPPAAAIAAAAVAIALVSAVALRAEPAGAQQGDVFLSEYVEGSGLNKALEVENQTGAPVDLGAEGYEIEIYFNGATSPNTTIALAGTVADGDVFVVADDGADPAVLAAADQITTSSLFNGDDAIVVRRGSTVVDSFGQVGSDPGSEWPGGGQDDTLRRGCADVPDTDEDDAFDAAAGWTVLATDTFDGLGTPEGCRSDGGGGGGGPLAEVAINEIRLNVSGPEADFVELVGLPGEALGGLGLVVLSGEFAPGQVDVAVDLEGTIGDDGFFVVGNDTVTPAPDQVIDADLFGSPTTYLVVGGLTGAAGTDLDTDDDGTLDTTPWDLVVAEVSLVDGDDVTDRSYGEPVVGPDSTFTPAHVYRCPDVTGTFLVGDFGGTDDDTPGAPNDCGGGGGAATPVLISEVQGSDADSPLEGEVVEVTGIVTSIFQDDDVDDAFFLQEEDADADADPATSEGVFVFCRGFCPSLDVGDQVAVVGEVDEFFGMTQIEPGDVDDLRVLSTNNPLPTPAPIELPADGPTTAEATFEATEGMVVAFPDTLVISEYFQLERFGQIVLSADERPYQYTHQFRPDVAGYAAYLAELATRRIILDDDNNDQNDAISGPDAPEPYPYPTDAWPTGGLSTEDLLRGGDTIAGLTGVLHWSFAGASDTNAWRVRPIDGLAYDVDGPSERPAEPDDVGGRLTFAAFNVLNYFTTIDETESRSEGPCGPDGTLDCRGADSVAELERQTAKVVAALAEMDADVVGLIEVQNDTESVDALVDALNAEVGAGTYAAIDTGFIGTDAIKVAFIYQPAAVSPVGDFVVFDGEEGCTLDEADPCFIPTKNRPALIQAFEEDATGAQVVATVNHFKSKGSDCADVGEDESIVDGQGNCSQVRLEAAQALAEFLATDPTGTGEDDVLILGDLNAYRMEDAIVALTDAGYTDLAEAFIGDEAYSFVFDGQLGYLDHAMANDSLLGQVTGVTEWHINADEVPLFDYDDDVLDPGEAFFEEESGALPLYAPDPYRSSDHDPVIVGLDLGAPSPSFECGPLTFTRAELEERGLNVIVGTDDGETLTGTNGPDAILALGGDDLVLPRGGADLVCLGDGDDAVIVGRGDNVVFGEAGDDAVFTGRGDDVIDTGAGDDFVRSGAGRDRVDTGGGDDFVLAGGGNDTIDAGGGFDVVAGGGGRDTCIDAELAFSCEVRRRD